jgi:hypothetical protein
VLTESIPLPAARLAEPIAVVPSLKVIVPVAEVGATVAVSVIACPDAAVAAEAVRVTVVVCSGAAAAFTWTDTALDVEDPSAASPAYDAVMLCVPAASDVMVKVAAPLGREDVPIVVDPSNRVTAPEGVDPVLAATVTLKVTDCPALIFVADAERVVVVGAAGVALGCTTNRTAE